MLHTANSLLKKALLASLLFFFSLSLGAQNLMNHVPKGAMFVAEFHLDRMDAKADLDSIGAMGFVKDLTRKAPAFFQNPSKFGVNLRKKTLLFYAVGEDLSYFSILLPLKESAKMKELPGASEGKWSLVPTENFFSIKEKKASFQEEKIKTIGAYNESFLLLFSDMTPPNFDYDLDLTYEERQEKRKNADKLKQVAIDAQIAEIMGMTGQNSIAMDVDFRSRYPQKGDVSIWVNSALGMGSYERMFRKIPMYSTFYRQMQGIVGGSYYTGSLDLDQGELLLDIETFGNPEIMEMAKEVSKAKINKKFSQYVNQENLIGYAAYAFNTYNAGKAYREMFTPMLDSFPSMPPGLATSMYDVLDIFIDEEAIAELIPGNMMLAFTGVKEFEKEFTEYEYNDSTYERTPVTRTRTETFPEFLFMLSTEREDDMKKILEVFSKIPMGRKQELLTNQGLYYSIPQLKEKIGMDVFFTVRDGILFISNNNELVINKLGSGYSGAQRLAKEHRKALKKSNQVIYMDFEKLFITLKQLPDRKMQKDEPQKTLEILASNMDEAWSRNYRRKDPSRAYVSISMKDDDKNALDQLANMVNEIFLATSRRANKKYSDIPPVDIEVEEEAVEEDND